MSVNSQHDDLRQRQEVAEQAKRLAEALASKTRTEKQLEFPQEFTASGEGKGGAAIEP